MKVEFIAECCHEINRTYCKSIGDMSQLPWNEAPQWQRESAISGVEFAIDNPDSDPVDIHNQWVKHKLKDGWQYGPIKDPEKKEHPCVCIYEVLPKEQKMKDEFFQTIIKLLK